MKKFFVFLFVLALFLPLALLAQDATPEPATFDLAVVTSILLTGIAGLPVSSLVELIKRALKWQDRKVYLIAFIVSAAAVAAYLLPLKLFSWPLFAGYLVLVFGEASGLYKMVKKPKQD